MAASFIKFNHGLPPKRGGNFNYTNFVAGGASAVRQMKYARWSDFNQKCVKARRRDVLPFTLTKLVFDFGG